MITIKLRGGLGNQMFQYALYCSMAEQNIDVCLDDYSSFNEKERPEHAGFGLSVFNAEYKRYKPNSMPDWVTSNDNLLHKIIRRLRFLQLPLPLYIEKSPSVYDAGVFNLKNKYIEGYWQSEKYFEGIKPHILTKFTYKGEWSSDNIKYRDSMNSSNSVSVHVRRGDYLQTSRYSNICTSDYYKTAIKYVKDHVVNPTFFIFSNDIDWCENFFDKTDNVVFVKGNDGTKAVFDMLLMSKCKHHIIANSSFSWWGAWLSPHEGITIAPNKWDNLCITPDIWCKNWIRI